MAWTRIQPRPPVFFAIQPVSPRMSITWRSQIPNIARPFRWEPLRWLMPMIPAFVRTQYSSIQRKADPTEVPAACGFVVDIRGFPLASDLDRFPFGRPGTGGRRRGNWIDEAQGLQTGVERLAVDAQFLRGRSEVAVRLVQRFDEDFLLIGRDQLG